MKSIIKKNWLYILIFAFIFVFNSVTPLIMDDYQYSFIYGIVGAERVNSLNDIVVSQINHYLHWGGRTVAHTIAQFFLMFPKWVFNIANSLVFCGLIYLICEHAKNLKCNRYVMIIVAFFAIWFFMPEFGQTILWLTGSCNYLWGSFFILLALLPFTRKLDNHEYKMNVYQIIFFAIISFIGGWCNENTSGALVFLMLVIIIALLFKRVKIEKHFYLFIILSLISFVIMILSPGNYLRSALVNPISDIIIVEYANRFANCMLMFRDVLLKIFILTLLIEMFNVFICNNKNSIEKTLIFLLGSLACNFAMILSPFYVARASFGAIVFAIIALVSSISSFSLDEKKSRFILSSALCVTVCYFMISCSFALIDDVSSFYLFKKRENYIISQVESGNGDITTFRIVGRTKYNALYHQHDLASENEQLRYLNDLYEDYYHADHIKIAD